jgi:hypothetical protein
MALVTARDIITKSLKLLGIGAEGETPTAGMANDALDSLNLLLSLWGARNLMTLAEIQETLVLTALQASYTIGVTSLVLPTDLDTPKPYRIINAFIRDTAGYDTRVDIISRNEYNALPIKTTGGRPDRLTQNPGATQQTNQVMTIDLYPVPDATTGYTLFLLSEKPLINIATLDDTIVMQDIYKAAMVSNLAMTIAPEYGRELHPMTIKMANDSLSAIETINSAQNRQIVDFDLPKPVSSNWMNGS